MTATVSATAMVPKDLSIAGRLFDLIDSGARGRDSEKGLPVATVDAFHDNGLFRALAPKDVGGGECGVREAFDIIEQISRADGAAGWALMAGMTTLAIAGAFLGDGAVSEVLSDPRAVTAGQVAPLGTATRTPDGVQIEGRFGFSSGSLHSSWIFGGYREHVGGEPVKLPNGMPNVLAALVPKHKVEFLGNWDVLGLEHTWSEDYQVPSQVVAEEFTFSVFDGKALRGGPSFGIGVNGLTCVAHSAWACGVARRALEELRIHLDAKRQPSRKTLIDDAHFQHEYALAEAGLSSSREYALSSLVALEEAAVANRVTLEARGRARLATSYACAQAVKVTSLAYSFSGSAGLRRGALQQCYRDISAGEQHIFTDHNSVINAGRVMLGVASPEMFF